MNAGRYRIRLATVTGDWDELSWLRTGVEARVRQMQEQQSTDLARGLDRMAGYVESGRMYVVLDRSNLVACYALAGQGDTAFWTPAELAEDALYLDNAMVRPDRMHQGLGRLITAHAVGEAVARQAGRLRLDCQRGNPKLRTHWEELGFSFVRDAVVPGRASGTLMEMSL